MLTKPGGGTDKKQKSVAKVWIMRRVRRKMGGVQKMMGRNVLEKAVMSE